MKTVAVTSIIYSLPVTIAVTGIRFTSNRAIGRDAWGNSTTISSASNGHLKRQVHVIYIPMLGLQHTESAIDQTMAIVLTFYISIAIIYITVVM